MQTYFLDTETTGLGATDRIVELAIVHESGSITFDSLINPNRPIPYFASRVHGITDGMVSTAPDFSDVWPEIKNIIVGNRVVIYNASFDKKFFPDQLACASEVRCAMLEFAAFHRQKFSSNRRKLRLLEAAEIAGHQWKGEQHRALADTFACRTVWFHLNGRPVPSPTSIPPRRGRAAIPTPRSSARLPAERPDDSRRDPLSRVPPRPPPIAMPVTAQISEKATERRQSDSSSRTESKAIYWIVGAVILLYFIFKK
jgi:DNA polymerase-3 subunit epsilon